MLRHTLRRSGPRDMGRSGGADGPVQRHHAAGRAGRFEKKRQDAFAALEAAKCATTTTPSLLTHNPFHFPYPHFLTPLLFPFLMRFTTHKLRARPFRPTR